MRIQHAQSNCFTKQYELQSVLSRRCTHILTILCWIAMILIGSIIAGVNSLNYLQTFEECTNDNNFCSYSFNLPQPYQIFIYARLTGLYQNNRMFLDNYNLKQMHGEIASNNHCGQYYTYGKLQKTQTAGGYRVQSSAHAHPCGQTMKRIYNDSIYIVNNKGETPEIINQALTSAYSKYHFTPLPKYQLSQWVYVKSSQFVNWFTVAATSTKYILMGKLSLSAGDYELIIRNNYPSQGQFQKHYIVASLTSIGFTNYVPGLVTFSAGVLMMFFHLYLCCKWRK